MDRERYLQEVYGRLSNKMPRKDLDSVMRYYEEYFNEAGPEREAEIIAELGSPEELAAKILGERGGRKSHGWAVGLAVAAGVLVLVAALGIAVARNLVFARVINGVTYSSVEDLAPVTAIEGDSVFAVNGVRTAYADNMAAFSEIEVDVALGNVWVAPGGDGYSLSLEWKGSGYSLKYENKDGKLRVWSEGTNALDWEIDKDKVNVWIYVPEGAQFKWVDLDVDLGECTVQGFTAKKLTVDADCGSVSLYDMTLGTAELALDLGSLELSAVKADQLDADLSMGDLNGYDLEMTGDLTAVNDMGKIELSGALRGTTELKCSMGAIKVYLDGSEEEYGYDLRTSMGRVTVDGKDKGTSTSRSGGEYRLNAKSDMGAVEVWFD